MSVQIHKASAMFNQVAALGGHTPLQVYAVLWEAAANDVRGDCGGTTSYSIKGLAAEIGRTRETVSAALNKLLDAGFIQIAGEEQNKGGSNNTVWRVTHPKMLAAVRYSIEVMGPPSQRLKQMRVKAKRPDITRYYETQCSWDF